MPKLQFVIATVRTVNNLIDSIDQFKALSAEWSAMGYSKALTDEDINTPDLPSKDDINGAFETLDAINALLAQGHATNLYRVRRRGV